MFDWDDINEFFADDFAETCDIGSEEYACIRYKSDRTDDTAPEGMAPSISFRLMLKTDDFPTPPLNNTKLTFNGSNYLIAAVETDSTGKGYLLSLDAWEGS